MTPAQREAKRVYREQRYARGQCVHCPRPRDCKSPRCAACRATAAANQRARDARKRR